MSPMSQQINPAALTAILSDPRAQPAQRMAAMSMLKQLQGGTNSPMAAPQGDGTGAGDMDPSFIQAVQKEMQGEQSPQGLPPAQGQQMAQAAPQDTGPSGDIAAGVDYANKHFSHGGAVRGYEDGGGVLKVGDKPFMNGQLLSLPTDPAQITRNSAFLGNLGPSVLGSAPQVEPEDDSKYGAMFEDAGKKYLESSADETTPEDDRNSALLKFGLGMMTSASKPGATFLGAAGEGGLNAVSEFEKARASRAENRMKKLGLIGNLAEREENRKDKKEQNKAREQEAIAKLEELKRSNLSQEKLEARQQEIMRQLGFDRNETNKILAKITGQQLESDKEKARIAALTLPPNLQTKVDGYTTDYSNSLKESTKLSNLAKTVENLGDKYPSGIVGRGEAAWKNWTGQYDETMRALNSVGDVVKAIQLGDVPRGPVSDKDLEFAKAFTASPYSDPKELAKYLRIVSAVKNAQAGESAFRASYLTLNHQNLGKDFNVGDVEIKAGTSQPMALEMYYDNLQRKREAEEAKREAEIVSNPPPLTTQPLKDNRTPLTNFFKPGGRFGGG